MRRFGLLVLLALVATLIVGVSGAGAVVVSNPSGRFGIAPLAGQATRDSLNSTGQVVLSSPSPCDPWLSSDLHQPTGGLCWNGGPVMHSNEVFDLAWDPLRRDWATTRDYLEQFMRDVADGSDTLTSPFAVTTQYKDASGRANNSSLYGGGCIDFGATGGSTCKFGNTTGTGTGLDYPASVCPPTGTNHFQETAANGIADTPNDVCLTDGQIRTELTAMITSIGSLDPTHVSGSRTPLMVLMLPPGVVACLESNGQVCSANSDLRSANPASNVVAQFCSYHAQVDVNGTEVAYVVQPWTALTSCDEPGVSALQQTMTPQQLAVNIGMRLASPMSQGEIAAIVNPDLHGWFAYDGSEINDNGAETDPANPATKDRCAPQPQSLDQVIVGTSGQNPYLLQREFNNGGVIASDPNAPFCAPGVQLAPAFVVPSTVNPGDLVELDGSKTVSTLLVPKADYHWQFGDGTSAIGPSVVHSYAADGTYAVALMVTDRGGNVRSLTQTIKVGSGGGSGGSGGGGGGSHSPQSQPGGLQAKLQLLPESLRSLLRKGLAMRVTSSESAAGIATLMISRGAARRAHIKLGHGASVVIGRGKLSSIGKGTINLRVHIAPSIARKLRQLQHLTLTVRLALTGADHGHVTVDAAGRY